jgi:hypothetical protein
MSSGVIRAIFCAVALAIGNTPVLAADGFGMTADEFVAAVNQRWRNFRGLGDCRSVSRWHHRRRLSVRA